MEVLNVIRDIVTRLTEEEKTVVRTYLSVFYYRGKPVKSLQLWDILIGDLKRKSGDLTSPAEIETSIYGKSSPSNFSRLLYRLREKILESLIIDVNVQRENVYDERTKVHIEIRKNLTQIQILRSRGLMDYTQSMLSRVIEQAKKYEIYEELLTATRLLIDHHCVEYGDKHLNKLLLSYEKYDAAKNAALRAEVNLGRVQAEWDYRTGQNAKTDWLKKMLDEMSSDYKKTTSSQVGFYYFYVLTQYYQHIEDYKSARKSLLDNLKLLDCNPGIYTGIRVGNVMVNLSDNDLYLREFQRAFKTASNSLRYFKPTSFNHTQAIELMFYAQFYLGEFAAAREIILQLLPDEDETTGIRYRLGKRLFLLACTLFMLKDYDATFKLASRVLNPIEEDKEGWNLGMRFLTILSLIELQQLDEAAGKILILKNFIENLDKSKVPERLKAVAVLLRKLSNAAFDFKNFYQKEKERIELLKQTVWIPKSPEMIIFDQWLIAKVFKQPFEQKIPPLAISKVIEKEHQDNPRSK